MDGFKLELYWNEIPIGRENALTYNDLCLNWKTSERSVRSILHELSSYDNGDDYILVRSSQGKGFYRTDNMDIIKAYREECLNRGKNVFAAVKKINRVLTANTDQFTLENNLRVERELHGLTQTDVCDIMKSIDNQFDKSLLSKMENGVCLPTPIQLNKLAEIYGCYPNELINSNLY